MGRVERDAEGYALLDRDPALFALVRTYAADGVAPARQRPDGPPHSPLKRATIPNGCV